MKVLYESSLLQGFWSADCNYCEPGELVHLEYDCGGDCTREGELCEECRVFCGMESLRVTTTAIVRETDMTFEELLECVRESFARAGLDLADAERAARDVSDCADAFEDGHIIQRGPTHICARGLADEPADSEEVGSIVQLLNRPHQSQYQGRWRKEHRWNHSRRTSQSSPRS